MIFSKPRTQFRPSRITDGQGRSIPGYENSLSIERSKLMHASSSIKEHTQGVYKSSLEDNENIEDEVRPTQGYTQAAQKKNLRYDILIKQKEGLSQRQIAAHFGLSHWTIRKILSGEQDDV